METGGQTIKSKLKKSNPTAISGYGSPECLPCKPGRGKGGNCRSSGVNFEMECQLCPAVTRSVYIGESARNPYSRGKEHIDWGRNKSKNSFINKPQTDKHHYPRSQAVQETV